MKRKQAEANTMTETDAVLDETNLRKKVFWELLSSPWTLWPFVGGVTALLALWTFSIRSGVAVFAALASILGAAGIFLTRLVLGSERLTKKAVAEMRQKAERQREESLDDLERQLRADGDARTESSLRDLRALAKAFEQEGTWATGLNTRSLFDILAGVEQLFKRCVVSLKKTLDLWYTAENMATPEARQPILQQRERIIEDVGKSIRQLGQILTGIQSLGVGETSEDTELARIREELDRSLEVARMVEKRMRSLDRDFDVSGVSENASAE